MTNPNNDIPQSLSLRYEEPYTVCYCKMEDIQKMQKYLDMFPNIYFVHDKDLVEELRKFMKAHPELYGPGTPVASPDDVLSQADTIFF